MLTISTDQAARARLISLLLSDPGRDAKTPGQVVQWFGAMQSQDLASGKWSFGVRLPGTGEPEIDAAIESGEVLRTWPMRGTIHFVPPADARWMLEVTGAKALAGGARRRAFLGLDLATVDKAADVLAQALAGGGRLTRAEAVTVMSDAGIATAKEHAYHLIWYSSQIGVACIGPNAGNEQTIVLLDEWAPHQQHLERDEALIELAWRFFRSHGPASVKDFAGWADLSMADSRKAIAGNEGRLVGADLDSQPVLLSTEVADAIASGACDPVATRATADGPTLALPGFDEFVLGYKNRAVQLPADYKDKIIPGGNGVFRATVSIAGRVVATWKRTVKKSGVVVDLIPFDRTHPNLVEIATPAFAQYAAYLGRPVTIEMTSED